MMATVVLNLSGLMSGLLQMFFKVKYSNNIIWSYKWKTMGSTKASNQDIWTE